MRRTVHAVPSRDYLLYQKALESALTRNFDEGLKQVYGTSNASVRTRLHERLLLLLSTGVFTIAELVPHVKDLLSVYPEKEHRRVLRWALRELAFLGRVCHAEPVGPWYHFKEVRFTTVDRWLGKTIRTRMTESEARIELLLKYIRGYGPASVHDFAYWGGLKVPEAREVFENSEGKLEEVTIAGVKGRFWLVKGTPIPEGRHAGTRSPEVRFLPEFDPLVMGHKDKSRFMEEKHRKRIFLPLASVTPVLLMDGRAAGTWDLKIGDRAVTLSPFEPLSPRQQRDVEYTAKQLRDFIGNKVEGMTS
jgi:hypothetical protein